MAAAASTENPTEQRSDAGEPPAATADQTATPKARSRARRGSTAAAAGTEAAAEQKSDAGEAVDGQAAGGEAAGSAPPKARSRARRASAAGAESADSFGGDVSAEGEPREVASPKARSRKAGGSNREPDETGAEGSGLPVATAGSVRSVGTPQQRGGGAMPPAEAEPDDAEHERPATAAKQGPADVDRAASTGAIDTATPAEAGSARDSDAPHAGSAGGRDDSAVTPKKSRRWWPFRRSAAAAKASGQSAATTAATPPTGDKGSGPSAADASAGVAAPPSSTTNVGESAAKPAGSTESTVSTGRDADPTASGRHAAASKDADSGTATVGGGDRLGRHSADVENDEGTAQPVGAVTAGKAVGGEPGEASAGEDGDSATRPGANPTGDTNPVVTDKGSGSANTTATAVADTSTGGAVATKDDADKGTEPDLWAEFAGRTEPPPSVVVRVGRRVGRFLRHEWTLAALISMAAAVVMTWPTLRYPRHTIPQDIWDPTLQAWQMSWSGHSLLTDPGRIWHSNAFYPELWTFAFSDSLLGYAPLGMIGEGPVAAIVRYNIVFVLAHALAAFGAYMLVRQLGAGRTGSAVAGAAYTYAPWLLAQAGHLHIISNGGIPLALAMLARGHGFSFRHGYRPERRHAGWALAGWLVAAWQLSLGFGIGLVFAYVLALLGVVALFTWLFKRFRVWKERRPFGRKLFFADLAGGAIFAAVGGLLAIPYFQVADDHPYARRGIEEIQLYSPPLRGFFTAPQESWLWGGLHQTLRDSLGWAPEMTLLPGFALIGLALAGLFFTIWTVRQRLLLVLGVAVATVLAMGSEFQEGRYTYLPLLEHVPGWDGIRTPGRLMLWVTLLLGILAAGAVCAFVERVKEISASRIPPWPSPWLRLVTLIPLALVLVEGINTTQHPIVPAQPAAMRTVEGPLLVLPSDQLHDENVMLWSTTKFQDIVNGGSGFVPKKLEEVRQVTATFPDQNSINYLRQMGVRNVIVARDWIQSGSPLQTAIELPVDSLGITREDVGSVVVYRL